MKKEEIINSIINGEADGAERRIYSALKLRRAALTSITAAVLQVGSRVEVKNISPKSLNGRHGFVTALPPSRASKRFTIMLDGDVIDTPGVPAGCLTLLG